MRCVICKANEVKPGITSFTVERGRMTLVLKGVPTRVCGQCGDLCAGSMPRNALGVAPPSPSCGRKQT